MKLYSRLQLVKNTIIGVVLGLFIATAGFSIYTRAKRSGSAGVPYAGGELVSQDEAQSSGEEKLVVQEESPESKKIAELEAKYDSLLSKTTEIANSTAVYTQDESQNIAVYEKCNEAVVNITTQEMGYNWFLEPVVQEGGSGSGSIIDKRGYVVTNVHVISKASKINISLADGSTYEGRVVGSDTESDIAVLKFEPKAGVTLKTIDFGNSDNLKVGQKVIAIGNPFALERTMTTGIISGLGRPIQESANVIIRNMIQTDAAINPGNSGGPLLDSTGKMVGINTMIISNSGSSAGLGFAVPVSTARRVVNDLIQFGKVNRGKLGIKPVQMSGDIANYINSANGQNAGLSRVAISSGIIISEVQPGSGAEKAGLRAGPLSVRSRYGFNTVTFNIGGDIITGIDNISVASYADYMSALESKRPGDSVTVTVYRDGEYKKIKVTLDGSASSTL
ncbi:MAG: trypsin-like peptidase domain-containing protein [Treponema sp.]|nr:trypsin-like peptidase domain-containing protein [Treponema sp.]